MCNVYIYIYIYVHMYMLYIYIYIYIHALHVRLPHRVARLRPIREVRLWKFGGSTNKNYIHIYIYIYI